MVSDLGKVLLLPQFGQLPQWAVVGEHRVLAIYMNNWFYFLINTSLNAQFKFYVSGDTFPLGCAFDESNVHHKVFLLLNISGNLSAYSNCSCKQSS